MTLLIFQGEEHPCLLYSIFGYFRDCLTLAFYAIYVKSQIIEYAEVISCIIFYNKLFKSQKTTDTNLKCYRFDFPHFRKFCYMRKKTQDIQYIPQRELWFFKSFCRHNDHKEGRSKSLGVKNIFFFYIL